MAETRTSTGRFTSDARRRDPLIRQVIRARRSVEADPRAKTTATGDLAKVTLVERAKRWAHGDGDGAVTDGAS